MEENAVAVRQEDRFLELALEKGGDINTIEKLIDLRNKELERVAKVEYDLHFAEMQKDYVSVGKNKQAKDEYGKTLYSYCPLETILSVYQPIISRHGFSYRWAEEALSETMKRIYCIVAGFGHEERSYIDIPIQAASRMTNATQQRGSATSYGKRYSFVNAFGIIIGGEDDDARGGGQEKGSEPGPGPAPTSKRQDNRPPHQPMPFPEFIKLVNKSPLPPRERSTWMQRAQEVKDNPEKLAALADKMEGIEIPAAEDQHTEPAPAQDVEARPAEEKPAEASQEPALEPQTTQDPPVAPKDEKDALLSKLGALNDYGARKQQILELIPTIPKEAQGEAHRMVIEAPDIQALNALYEGLVAQYGKPAGQLDIF